MGLDDRDYYRDAFNKIVNQHENSSSRPSRNSNHKPPSQNKFPWGIIIICVLAVTVLLNLYNYNASRHHVLEQKKNPGIINKISPPKIPQLIPPSQLLLQEKPLPENGSYRTYYPADSYVAPLVLEADPNNNYIVKLVDTSKHPVLYAFVRANNSVKIKAPLGIYELQWVYGKNWYGDEHLFGNSSIYMKAAQNYMFDEESTDTGKRRRGHTITFKNVITGNMPSEKISANEFSYQ